MENNFGTLNTFKDYREEYIKTLEALVASQKELIGALQRAQAVPQPGLGTAPWNPFAPYATPFVNPTITYKTTGGNIGPYSDVLCYNSGNMQSTAGPECSA